MPNGRQSRPWLILSGCRKGEGNGTCLGRGRLACRISLDVGTSDTYFQQCFPSAVFGVVRESAWGCHVVFVVRLLDATSLAHVCMCPFGH